MYSLIQPQTASYSLGLLGNQRYHNYPRKHWAYVKGIVGLGHTPRIPQKIIGFEVKRGKIRQWQSGSRLNEPKFLSDNRARGSSYSLERPQMGVFARCSARLSKAYIIWSNVFDHIPSITLSATFHSTPFSWSKKLWLFEIQSFAFRTFNPPPKILICSESWEEGFWKTQRWSKEKYILLLISLAFSNMKINSKSKN